MKKYSIVSLMSIFFGAVAFANGPTGTVGVDEKHLEELKKDRAVLEKQEQQSTEAIHQKQREKYKVPGASETRDKPIFRQSPSGDQ